MIVDFLRSCYQSSFRIDEANDTQISGRYYWALSGAEIYLEPTWARSAVWLDPWDQSEGIGDLYENVSYKSGAFYFIVDSTRRGTALAQTGCGGALSVVDGQNGFPLKCRAVPPPSMTVTWGDVFYTNSVTGEVIHVPNNVAENPLWVGDYTWKLDTTDILGHHYHVTMKLRDGIFFFEMLVISSMSATLLVTCNFPYVRGLQVYPIVLTAPTAPWTGNHPGTLAMFYHEFF
jgi:hypothetical protein